MADALVHYDGSHLAYLFEWPVHAFNVISLLYKISGEMSIRIRNTILPSKMSKLYLEQSS